MIAPDFAFAGTVTVSFVGDTTLNCAGTPLIVTDVVPVRFVPVTVTVAPGLAVRGCDLRDRRHGSRQRRKPFLTKIACPAGLSTFFSHACAAAWFGLFVTTAIAYVIFGCAHAGTLISDRCVGSIT